MCVQTKIIANYFVPFCYRFISYSKSWNEILVQTGVVHVRGVPSNIILDYHSTVRPGFKLVHSGSREYQPVTLSLFPLLLVKALFIN